MRVTHVITRLIVGGAQENTIASVLGCTRESISAFASNPAGRELIAHYRAEVHASWRDHVDYINTDSLRALKQPTRNLTERLEVLDEDPEAIPIKEVATITFGLMDRFGYGKHTTSTNINIGFAAKLEAAIARSRKVAIG